jgi:Putative adhesin
MSVRSNSFPAGTTPPEIEVRNHAGTVAIEAVEGADSLDVRVEALDSAAEELLDEVEIDARPASPDTPLRVRVLVPQRRLFRAGTFAVTVRTPAGARARVSVASADVAVRGPMGRLDLSGASGDFEVEQCTELHARSASGDLRIGVVTGRATVASASGDVRADRAGGGLQGRTASGDIEIGEAAGDVSLTTASGDLDLAAAAEGSIHVRSVSGDVTIGVVPGLRVWLDLSSVSGRMHSQLDEDAAAGDEGAPQLSITMRSVSGDLRVRRAAASPR